MQWASEFIARNKDSSTHWLSTYKQVHNLSFLICERGADGKAVPSPHSCEDEIQPKAQAQGGTQLNPTVLKPHTSASFSKPSHDSLLCLNFMSLVSHPLSHLPFPILLAWPSPLGRCRVSEGGPVEEWCSQVWRS